MGSQQSKPKKPSHGQNHVHVNPMNELNDLRPLSYKPGHILHELRQTAERQNIIADLTPQEKAILAAPHSPCLNQKDVEDFVKSYFLILDKMYFFNSIKKNFAGFKFFPRGSDNCYGFYESETSTIHIEYPISLRGGQTPGQDYIGTLVHEMLHAFLAMYVCMCDSCIKTSHAGSIIHQTSEGEFSGHGPMWANCMVSIQDSMTRELGWQVDCGIARAVEVQMQRTNWQPKDHQLVRWGIGHLTGQPQSTRQPHSIRQPDSTRQPQSTRHQMEPFHQEESDEESENAEGEWVICCCGYICCQFI